MASPITWQNINAPSFGEANRLMGQAQQSILGAFDGAKTALAESQAFDKELWKRQDADFTQRQLAAMYAAKTPEALAALQASGQMGMAVDTNGARADMAVINKAFDERPGIVQDRRVKDIAYANAERDNVDAPILAQSRAALLKKDYAGVAALAAQMSPQAQAVIGKELDAYQRELVVRSQTDDKAKAELDNFAAQREKWKADTKNQEGQLQVSRGQLGVAQQNAQTQANEARLRGELAQGTRLAKELAFVDEAIGNTDSLATSNTGYKKITDWLATVKDPKKQELLNSALGKARASGELSGLSASQAIAAMQADTDTSNWFGWSDNTGDGLTKQLQKFKNSTASPESTAAINKSAELQKMRADIIGRLYPGLVTSTPFESGNPGTAASGSVGAPSTGSGAPGTAAPVTEPANSPWTPKLREQEKADRERIAKTGGTYSPEVAKALEKEAELVRTTQQESSAEKLKRVEAEIRDKYKAPSGYETVYDRRNRTTNMQFELAQAKELVKSVDPQVASDRVALAQFLESLKDANGNAGAAIADVGLTIPRAALTAYDTGVLRPLRAAGLNLPNTAPLLTPNGVSTSSLTPFTDVRRMRQALQDEAKKQK